MVEAPSETSQRVLCKQYLHKGDKYPECSFCGQQHESLDEMLDRVSFGNEKYSKILSSFDFLPNSPTLFNAGGEGTLSACFKFDVQDTIESILDVHKKSALVQKWGGGVGYCLSALRPRGSAISSTHGQACGPVAVIHMYQALSKLITIGGKRAGAQMAILHCDHSDIEEFIRCKEIEGILSTFNISVAVTDAFMRNSIAKPDSQEGHLFRSITQGAWGNGDPGLYFIDTAEKNNPTPWLGELTGTNPCGEVPLLDNEACNLGSINLSHFVENGRVDFDRLIEVVYLATQYLDDVVDRNFYVVPEVEEATLKTRKLGLGVMGWADALARMHIPYDSQEAVDLGAQVMQTIQLESHNASHDLWSERGPYPAAVDGIEVRNACVTCIAPAGSISTIANCSSGIEPHYSLEYTQVMGDGSKLERKLNFGDFVPKTAEEIPWEWHIKHQSAFQKHTDSAVSKTINMPNNTTEEDVAKSYIMAWESGCKGITVYREGSRQVQALYKADTPEVYATDTKWGERRRKLPRDRISLTHKFDLSDIEGYIHIGLFLDGSPGELFITASKQGSTVSGLLDGIAILTSLALQYGVPLNAIVSKLQGTRFEPAGLTANKAIPTASSLLDYIFRYVQWRCSGSKVIEPESSGMICPDCGASVRFQEGCMYCSAECGWSRC